MRKKFVVSIVLYILYGIVLTLILSFGTQYAVKVSNYLKELYKEKNKGLVIKEFTPNIKNEYLVGKRYKLEFTVKAKGTEEYGFIYESLDPDIVSVDSNGYFEGVKTNEFNTSGRIKITSSQDKKFSKIISLNFVRKYPDSYQIEARTESVGEGNITYVGLPVYINVSLISSSGYTDSDYVLTYSEEYFEKIDDTTYIPIKESENAWFKVTSGNGYETIYTMNIKEKPQEIEEFDDIYYYDSVLDKLMPMQDKVFSPSNKFVLYIIKDGKEVYSKISSIESSDQSVIAFNKENVASCKGVGEAIITITLPNGFSLSKKVTVQHKMSIPEIEVDKLDESGNIIINKDNDNEFKLVYPIANNYFDLKAIYDKEIINIQISKNVLYVKGLKEGITTVKLYLDDGYMYLEEEISFSIGPVIIPDAVIEKKVSLFTAKVLGHMLLFFVLSMFSLNVIVHKRRRKIIVDLIILILSGLIFALLTEFIQLYLPGRVSSLKDVLVDMTGFFIGTIFFGMIILIIRLLKKIFRRE